MASTSSNVGRGLLFSGQVLRSTAFVGMLLLPLSFAATRQAQAQVAAPPAAGASSRLIGTVRTVSGTSLTVAKDDGTSLTLTLTDAVRVQELPAGSTDIKTAQDATVADIAVGDRVLIAARAADGGALNATRVVLMKSAAIAQTNATRQQDWQHRGSGGIVSAVDPAAKTVTVAAGTRKTTVQVSDRTVIRRYAPGSVKFEEAKLGTLADIAAGDQLRVRGSKDVDTGSIAADEIVSGSFLNLAGVVATVNAAAGTLTLNDLATKAKVTVAVSSDSDLRTLPPEIAARFATRARGGTAGGGATGGSGTPAPSTTPAGNQAADGGRPAGAPDGAARARAGGGDLSQLVPRLPKSSLADIKAGEAVMIVASGSSAGLRGPVVAITLLSGVEPLLAASPSGTSSFNLSPWNLGGGGEAAVGGAAQ